MQSADEIIGQPQLPKHQKRACHIVNLIATVDIREADRNTLYRQLSRSAFAKCQALLNKTGRSCTAAETVGAI